MTDETPDPGTFAGRERIERMLRQVFRDEVEAAFLFLREDGYDDILHTRSASAIFGTVYEARFRSATREVHVTVYHSAGNDPSLHDGCRVSGWLSRRRPRPRRPPRSMDDYMDVKLYLLDKRPDLAATVQDFAVPPPVTAAVIASGVRRYAEIVRDHVRDVVRGDTWATGYFTPWS